MATEQLYASSIDSNPGSYAAVGGGVEILHDSSTATYYWINTVAPGTYVIIFNVADLPAYLLAPYSSAKYFGYINFTNTAADGSAYLYLCNDGDTQRTKNVSATGAGAYQRNNSLEDLQPDINAASPFTFTSAADVNEKKLKVYTDHAAGFSTYKVYEMWWQIDGVLPQGGIIPAFAASLGPLISCLALWEMPSVARVIHRKTGLLIHPSEYLQCWRDIREYRYPRSFIMGGLCYV